MTVRSGDLRFSLARTRTPRGCPQTLREKAPQMADVLFVALTLGIFVLLALILRGLEKIQ
jgi:hypothetical protein